MKSLNNRTFAPLIIILIVAGVLLVVVGGGWWWYTKNVQCWNCYGFFPPESSSTIQQIANGSTSLTTGWKTYTSNRYGYKFEYPEHPLKDSIQEFSSGGSVWIDPSARFLPASTIEIDAVFYPKDSFDLKLYLEKRIDNEYEENKKEILGQEKIGDYVWSKYSYNQFCFKYKDEIKNGVRVTVPITPPECKRHLIYGTFHDGVAITFDKHSYFDVYFDDQIFRKMIASLRFVIPSSQRIDKEFYSLKVGDIFGDLRISYITGCDFERESCWREKLASLDNAVVGFSGQLALTGEYYFYGEVGGTTFCFNPDQQSLAKIPMTSEWFKYQKRWDPFLCFSNVDSYEELSKIDPYINPRYPYFSHYSTTTILVDNIREEFVIDFIWIKARLVKILNSF